MNLFIFLKNLFKKKETVVKSSLTEYKDIFGRPITVHDLVFPIAYNDVKRRGYLTINGNSKVYTGSELTKEYVKNGVVHELELMQPSRNVKRIDSKRGTFYHIYCSENELEM